MWVEKQKNGKHKFVERYTDYMTGQEKKVSVTLAKDNKATRKQAYDILQEKIQTAIRESGMQETSKDITLEELCNEYLENQKETVRDRSYRAQLSNCKMILEALGKDVIVNRLTIRYVKKRFKETKKENITLNNYRKRLFSILNYGYKEGLINRPDWKDKFEPYKEEVTYTDRIEEKYLEGNEVRILLRAMKDNQLYKYISYFIVLCGTRIGETIDLDISDLDFEKRMVHIVSTYNYEGKTSGPAKTSTGMRDVYMQDDLYHLCKEIVNWNKKQQLLYGYRTDLLFNIFGEHVRYHGYEEYLKKISGQVLGKEITTHYLRHTHASLMLEAGVDCETVARRLGHKDSSFTRRIYIHITKKRKEKENEKIRQIKII